MALFLPGFEIFEYVYGRFQWLVSRRVVVTFTTKDYGMIKYEGYLTKGW